MKEYCDLPQNQLRKVLNFKHCIADLEELQRVYGFQKDTVVNQLLEILTEETKRVMEQLQKGE